MKAVVIEIKCPKCGYSWVPRVRNVKECPKCKRYLPKEERDEDQV
jgi:predicted Zn-ribbon and HTH transcriptional regulator